MKKSKQVDAVKSKKSKSKVSFISLSFFNTLKVEFDVGKGA